MQLALDRLTQDQCSLIVQEVRELVDYIELGTGVIKQYGISIAAHIKQLCPDKRIVVDMKTCDAGRAETEQALSAGADVTTVMAFAEEQTIRASLETADRLRKEVMIDLLGVSDVNRIRQLYEWGARLFCVHKGKDLQQTDVNGLANIEAVQMLRELPGAGFAYAGGVNLDNIDRILPLRPNILIVGSAITGAMHRREAAIALKRKCDDYETMV